MTTFDQLNLIEPILSAVKAEGYTTPTPIQAQSIPVLLQGKDLLGIAQTGTGKTAAFSLPLLQHLVHSKKVPSRGAPRALILAPTRELAAQIGESLRAYGKNVRLTSSVIFGGVGQGPQVNALQRGLDILVATPGRLLDLIEQRHCRLDQVEVFVLDEADRMLDMGFMPDIRRIIKMLPQKRQSLFFSATMAGEVGRLASSMLIDPVRVEVTPSATTVERIEQKVLFVDKNNKEQLLLDLLAGEQQLERVLVFTRTKHGANKVALKLTKAGIYADAIHGNKSQTARMIALKNFKSGRVRVLVATDIAARGIDIDDISHVINYELPNEAENYVHRIGRTARAGAEGTAYSFCAADEREFLHNIEKLIRMKLPVMEHRFHSEHAQNARGAEARQPPRGQQFRGPRRQGYGGGQRGFGGGHSRQSGERSHGGERSSHGERAGGYGKPRPHGKPRFHR